MKMLFLTRDLPYPATNGYKKRNFFLLKELAKRGWETVLFCENSSGNLVDIPIELKQYAKKIEVITVKPKSKFGSFISSLFSSLPVSVKVRTFAKVKKEICEYVKKNPVDVIICDAIYRTLNISFEIPAYKILYEHNIESVIIRRYIQNETHLFKKLFALLEYWKLEQFQKKIWRRFDCCIVCSSLDKKIIEEKAKKINIHVINNGVDTDYFNQNSYIRDKNTLVYTGEIGWYPNEDAVIYFVKNIFPLIKRKKPQTSFWIVGNNPSPRIEKLIKEDNSIIVTGFVEDVREFIGKACIYVVPLRIGAGTRLKILEALSMQKPVVSTSIGCEGLKVKHNQHLLIEDEPERFAKAVLTLLNDEDLQNSLGSKGRRLVGEKYDWRVVFKDFGQILEAIPSKKGNKQ